MFVRTHATSSGLLLKSNYVPAVDMIVEIVVEVVVDVVIVI